MNRRTSQLYTWISALWLLAATANPSAGQDARATGASSPGSSVPQRLAPPPLPPSKPPVDFFRELLSMTPGERQKVLANRPPESQKLILAKIQEYEALAPEQRELRLRVTELRYYLLPLMSVPASGRGPMLERVPAEFRPLIEERVSRWDALSPEKQKELLDNETWLRHIAETSSSTPTEQQRTLTNMPAAQRQALEAAVTKWQSLNENRRQEIAQRFEDYFGLKPQERARTLRAFSESERRQMERTLQSFSKLDPDKRSRCVRALDKLALLTPVEREEFLRNAERWQALSSAERKSWRDLVLTLSLPPTPRVPAPPLPPSPRNPRSAAAVATNQ